MDERLVRVRVTAGARKETVAEKDGTFVVAVKEPAEANAANARVRAILAAHFAVPLARVQLKSGHQKPSKLFVIRQ
jgi:uncharacterized protein YggU (UPF0235/DUF167 family)